MHLCNCGFCNIMIEDNKRYSNGHNGRGKPGSRLGMKNSLEANEKNRVNHLGEKNHRFNNGERDYRWAEWRKSVLEKDKYKCQLCSEERPNERLCVFRIKEDLELKYIISNGLTAHRSCLTKLQMCRLEIKNRRKQYMLNGGAEKAINTKLGLMKDPEYRKKICIIQKEIANRPEIKIRKRQIMINGGASYVNSFIKNPSKPQVALHELTKQLFPEAQLNYPIREVNRNIDIAIPEYMIAIEYDGSWWHQDKESDKKRQEQLESLGWKFIRYKDYIPTLEELESNIKSNCL